MLRQTPCFVSSAFLGKIKGLVGFTNQIIQHLLSITTFNLR